MTVIYYVQTNLICIAILLLLQVQLHKRSEKFSAEMIVLNQLIGTTVILCTSDLVAGVFRGRLFWGSRTIIEVSNLIFYEALVVISYLWMKYVNIKLNFLTEMSKIKRFLWSLPLIILTVLCVINPLTHFMFSIDVNNLYSREIGIIYHWIVTWLYLIVPTVLAFWAMSHEKNKQRRQEIKPLLYFVIPPFFCSFIQMLFYGVTTSQVGVTLSILIIFLVIQRRQIMTDALTGLNNRHGLEQYVQANYASNLESNIFVLMLDLNNFKQINDKLGHMVGDCALKDTADALKQACKDVSGRLFLCRFGGDEFVFIMHDSSQYEVEQLRTCIKQELEKINVTCGRSYIIDTSIGLAEGRCANLEDVEHLIRVADEAMYHDKKQTKRSPNSMG